MDRATAARGGKGAQYSWVAPYYGYDPAVETLVLTATGDLSRNRRVGLMLAEGRRLNDALAELGHVAEGVHTAPTLQRRARALGVDMPITDAVVAVLAGELTPAKALRQLMARESRPEA